MASIFRSESRGELAPGSEFTEVGVMEHAGTRFASGGAHITDDRLVAYLSDTAVQTWNGTPIGTYRITKRWKCPIISSRRGLVGRYEMCQVWIELKDGRRYQGRSQGVGMVVTARRVKGAR